MIHKLTDRVAKSAIQSIRRSRRHFRPGNRPATGFERANARLLMLRDETPRGPVRNSRASPDRNTGELRTDC